MPFKIIETIERGKRLIETVPSSWERDGNLSWPIKHILSLKKNDKSSPLPNWKTIPCILLKDNIKDYDTAQQEMALLSDATDIDTDKENQCSNERRRSNVAIDLNNLVAECIELEETSSGTLVQDTFSGAEAINSTPAVVAENTFSSTVLESNTQASTNVIDDIFIHQPSQENTNNTNTLLLSDMTHQTPQHVPQTTNESILVSQENQVLIEMISSVQENQKVLFENQQNILKGLALLNTKLEEYFKRSERPIQHEQVRSFKMITIVEELIKFEEQLKNPIIDAKCLKELSIMCSHKKSGYNNAYALVDAMFDRQLMTRCSWAGGTKSSPKQCFMIFTKILDLFLRIISQYDKTFTKPICEDFFKNILRHSKKRVVAKRTRSSTTKTKIRNSAGSDPRPETVSDGRETGGESNPGPSMTQTAC